MDDIDNTAFGDDSKKELEEEEKNKPDVMKVDSPSGGKKVKLNDGSGSSQDSMDEGDVKEDNVDSGVAADRSESTEGPSTSSAQESNIVINAGPSTSNVHRIFLNIKKPRLGRNYRKRKSSDRDSDSSDSQLDSDDVSVNFDMDEGDMDQESADGERTQDNDVSFVVSSGTSSTSNSNSSSSNSVGFDSEDDESNFGELYTAEVGGRRWVGLNLADGIANGDANKPAVLNKLHPKHNWVALKEIMSRELGHPYPFTSDPKRACNFEQRFSSSLHAMYRMKRSHRLFKHRGCVNAINFHPSGHLLASGSDDTNVIIWDWARKHPLQVIKTGHRSNVFQSKFLYLNAGNEINIVTCARDGQVRLLSCGPAGGVPTRRKLYSHTRAAHRLHVWPTEPHLLLSAAEDGAVMRADVRDPGVTTVLTVSNISSQSSKRKAGLVPLYSVHGHPLEPHKIIVAGRDKFVRAYDCRAPTEPIAMYCPSAFIDNSTKHTQKRSIYRTMHMTCAVYNHDGSEILGSYNNEDIYLFNADQDVYDKNKPSKFGYTNKYSGHRNCATFKGVSFVGPRSEYVVSGSDCSYIYIWDKATEAIVQWLQGDSDGVVNYVEAHPNAPILASSGLNYDVKIWMPTLDEDPVHKGLEQTVRLNANTHVRDSIFGDILPSFTGQLVSEDEEIPSPLRNIEFNGNVCTTF